MMERDDILEACRYTDAQAEEFGSLEAIAQVLGIEINGYVYVAEQRGLRVALVRDGNDPTRLSRTAETRVQLSPESRNELPLFCASWMDGFVCGVAAARKEHRDDSD